MTSPGLILRDRIRHYPWGSHGQWESVYFAQRDGTAGLIKIGKSGNPEKRVRSLATAAAAPVHLLAAVPGWVIREDEAHRAVARSRVIGEWFEPDLAVQELMRRVVAAHEQWSPLRQRIEAIGFLSWSTQHRPLERQVAIEKEFARRERWRRRNGIDY